MLPEFLIRNLNLISVYTPSIITVSLPHRLLPYHHNSFLDFLNSLHHETLLLTDILQHNQNIFTYF